MVGAVTTPLSSLPCHVANDFIQAHDKFSISNFSTSRAVVILMGYRCGSRSSAHGQGSLLKDAVSPAGTGVNDINIHQHQSECH